MLRVYNLLLDAYGPQGWWPILNPETLECDYNGDAPKDDSERFEICVGAILTQNTSWKNVEKALAELKKSKLLSKEGVLGSDKLPELIHSAGYHNQKAKKLKVFAEFSGEITRANLLSLWGIGPETADSILLYAYGIPVFVVDAYTRRIFSRVGAIDPSASYDEIQHLFHRSLENDSRLFNEYHALLVEHAKRHCKSVPECQGCPINGLCRSFKKQKQ